MSGSDPVVPADGKPAPAVPATVPLASDTTAATAKSGTTVKGAAAIAAAATTKTTLPAPNLPVPDGSAEPKGSPMVRVPATVPLPADQLTPLVRAGDLVSGGRYSIVIEDGNVVGIDPVTDDTDWSEIRSVLSIGDDTDREQILAHLRQLVGEHAAFGDRLVGDRIEGTMFKRPELLGPDGEPLTPPTPVEERRGFPVTFDVHHDGDAYEPGDTVFVTRAEHAQLFASTAIAQRDWYAGREEPA